jgi:hypothetical protein
MITLQSMRENSFPGLGTVQEAGGQRLWVHRAGSGGPAVVFLPGASLVGLDYLTSASKPRS